MDSMKQAILCGVLQLATITAASGMLWLNPPLWAQESTSQEVLTNQSVLKMVKNGVPASVIADMVRSHPGKYQLNSEDVIRLRREGVPASVLQAMIEKQPFSESAKPQPKLSAERAGPANAQWEISPSSDKLTGQPSITAVRTIDVEDGAKVRVTATCGTSDDVARLNSLSFNQQLAAIMRQAGVPDAEPNQQAPPRQNRPQLDTRALSFRFYYVPKPGSGISVRKTPVPAEATVHKGIFGSDDTVDVSGGGVCPYLRVMVGDHGRAGVQSEICDLNNVAAIGFINFRVRDLMASLLAENPDATNNVLVKLMEVYGDAKDPSVATLDEALRTNNLQVELPLTDGGAAVVTMDPQESSFKKFAAACIARFPPPAGSSLPSSAGHSALPSGMLLATQTRVPSGGARFVPVSDAEATQIMNKYWGEDSGALPDYAERFKTAEILPSGTPLSPLASYKPKNVVAAHDTDVHRQFGMFTSVGKTTARVVELGDGRLGLVPEEDLRQGYAFYAKNPSDPLRAAVSVPKPPEVVPGRQFEGTAEQFAAVFPELLRKAALANGLAPETFDGEKAYIIDLVRTCAQVTPAMVQSVTDAQDRVLLNRLGSGQYKRCNWTFSDVTPYVRTWDKQKERGIYIMGPRPAGRWPDGHGFTVKILFTRLPTDVPVPTDKLDSRCMIVEAKIQQP